MRDNRVAFFANCSTIPRVPQLPSRRCQSTQHLVVRVLLIRETIVQRDNIPAGATGGSVLSPSHSGQSALPVSSARAYLQYAGDIPPPMTVATNRHCTTNVDRWRVRIWSRPPLRVMCRLQVGSKLSGAAAVAPTRSSSIAMILSCKQ